MQEGDLLMCIDTWEGGEEHSEEDMQEVYERFHRNVEKLSNLKPFSWATRIARSSEALADAIGGGGPPYHFIYIDGSHQAKDVLTDACMAWQVLAPGGIMVFDDYLWGNPRDVLHRPKIAIDAFTNIFAEELQVIHSGYQLIVKRKAE